MGQRRDKSYGLPNWFVRIQTEVLWGAIRILRSLPTRWVLAFADRAGDAFYLFNGRGRRVSHQNLRVAFGDELPPAEAKRIAQASFRESLRSAVLLLHLHPLTRDRLAEWIFFPDDFETEQSFKTLQDRGGVLVSGHVGNWEMLLTLRTLFDGLPELVFMAEAIPSRAVNEVLNRLREHGGVWPATRKGGVLKLVRALKQCKMTGILADRNVRGRHGGVYAPFLGVPARTTPAPAWLALRARAPLIPVFLFPEAGRYRLWLGPDLSENLPDGTHDEQIEILTKRVNDVVGAVVRAAPEAWNWALKRFKGRPTKELGPYPPYSRYDPDPS